MRKFRSYSMLSGLALVFSAAVFLSCKDESPLRPKTISDIITEDSRFSILHAVLKKSGMSDAMRTGTLTFFAPDNNAFGKMSISDASQVSSLNGDSLRGIIQYLLLEGGRKAESFPTGAKQEVRAFDGANLFITRNQEGFMVNMARVTSSDIVADNGIIHVIDHVPSSSKLSLVEWLQSNPSFSFFTAAAIKAASYNPLLMDELRKETASFTVFAPTNQAFANAGFPTIESVNNTSAEVLAAILANHILRNAYFSTEFKTGQVGTIAGSPLLINVGGVISVAGSGNFGTLPTISRSDILTRNGVIHILDGVIIP